MGHLDRSDRHRNVPIRGRSAAASGAPGGECVTLDRWLATHPYLEPIARLDAEVEREMDGIALNTAAIPGWDCYFADYVAGVPVLESQSVAIDLAPVEKALALAVGRLAWTPLPDALRKQAEILDAELRDTSDR